MDLMLEIKIKDKKCDMDIRGDRFECIAEMTIAFDALIESAAAANGMITAGAQSFAVIR